MRSFIKKLAGTMALTMVVSSIAPAGVVFADDEAFIAMQGGDTMVSSITLATGRKVDFRFVGAPANWAELDPTWTSSIPAVADVDAAGVVTAKKAGVTTITIALSNGWTATAKVTVEDIPNDTEAPVYLAFQNTLEAVTNAHVLINTKDGVDFWFINAPEGWEKMNPTWASSNTEVATVDGAGIVRGIADGFTTLTFSLNGEVVASTEITVGNPVVEEPVVEADFVVEGIDARYELYDEEGNLEGYALLDEETAITVGDALNVSVYYEAYSLDQYGNILVDYSDIYFDEFAWTSSDEEVVTVEDGVLTAVGAGEATLTVAGVVVDGQEEEFTTTVKVAEVAVDESYTVDQKTDKQIVLTFASEEVAAAVKKEDLTLVKVRAAGTTSFPVSKVEVNADDKTQVIVTTYTAFGKGDTYRITVGEGEYTEFNTEYGYVDELVLSYSSYENGSEIKFNGVAGAYANAEDEDSITVNLSAKLFSKGVDVTNAAGYENPEISYSIEGEYNDEEVEIDEEGILTFYKAGVAVLVKATYTYENDKEEEVSFDTFVEVESIAVPEYKIVGVKDWAFVADGATKVEFSDKTKTVPAGDSVSIVALIEDSYGNVYITKKLDDYKDHKFIEADGSKFADEDYFISFSSTDVTKAIVNDDEVSTWDAATNAGIIVTLNNSETGKSEDLFCAEFDVTAARKLDKLTVATDSFKILSEGTFVTKDVTIKLFDQYNAAWKNAENITITAKARVNREDKEYTVSVNDIKNNGDGTYTFKFNALDAANSIGKDAKKDVTIKYTVTIDKKSDTFSAELVTPATKATFGLEASNAAQTLATDATSDVVKSKVTFYEYRNGLQYNVVDTSDVTIVASQGALEAILKYTDKNSNVGDKFLVVYKPDGKVFDATGSAFGVTRNDDNTFSVVVAKATGSEIASSDAMIYAPTGTYKAQILQIEKYKNSGVASFKEYTAKFDVTKANKEVAVAGQTQLTSASSDVRQMILDAVDFKLGGAAWSETEGWNKLTADDIFYTEGVDVIEAGDYVVVKTVTVRVRVSEKLSDVYYEVKVPVNKTIERVSE